MQVDLGLVMPTAVSALADGTRVVLVSGEIDLATAPELERILAEAADGGDHGVVVELAGDSFIDSTGLGVLIRTARLLGSSGRSFEVATANAHIRGVVETMGLTEALALRAPGAP